MTPPLTNAEKDRFMAEFSRIISESSEEIQESWDKEITWVHDIPHFTGNVHLKLQGKQADQYVALLNRLKGRAI
jgi:hypothetical protein